MVEDAQTDWRAAMIGRVRRTIMAVDPGIVEEAKWRKPSNPAGVPTWSLDGIICTGETYRDKVKLTFMKGRQLADAKGLFNASLEGVRRAIDIGPDDDLDEAALADLVRQAIALNRG